MNRVFLMLALSMTAIAHSEWQDPVNIGSILNSPANDWYPVIARDGSFMIFVSDRQGGYGQADLWISHRGEDQWGPPENLGPMVNSSFTESAPYLAPGDSVLYFASLMPGGHGSLDIYRCSFVNGIPGSVENFGTPVNSGAMDCCPVIASDGSTIYFCSTRAGGFGSMDAWMSQRTAEVWSEPVNLGAGVNSAATDCPRWLSDDGMTMLICSTRGEGYGDADMWITQRVGDTWGPLVNMGATLNSSAAELGASFLNNDEAVRTIYFGSGRSGGYGGWDIWYAQEATDASTPPPKPAIGLSLYPNPSRTGTTITYVLSEATRVVVGIYDLQGRLTKLLLDQHVGPGCHCMRWDSTTDQGDHAPHGLYCCSVKAGDARRTERVIVSD